MWRWKMSKTVLQSLSIEFVVPVHAVHRCLLEALPDRLQSQDDVQAIAKAVRLNLEQHWADAFEQAIEDFTNKHKEEVDDD
jgi:hypothetical protein